MKKTLLAALCAIGAACGGGDKPDPTKVTFSYPTSSPVTAGTPEADAASVGATGLSETQTIQTTNDPAAADPNGGGSIVTLGDQIAEAAAPAEASAAAGKTALRAAARKAIAAGLPQAPQAFDPGCVSVTPGAIVYSNCVDTFTDADGTQTVRLNGSLTRTITVGEAVIAWDLSLSVSGTNPFGTFGATGHFTGQLTIDASTIVGATRSDTTASGSIFGFTFSEAVTHLADYDLEYVATPAFCLTGGTIEVRRVWTERPDGATAADLPDVGILFTFGPECGQAQVGWGVR